MWEKKDTEIEERFWAKFPRNTILKIKREQRGLYQTKMLLQSKRKKQQNEEMT